MSQEGAKPGNVAEFRKLCDELIAIKQAPRADAEERVRLEKQLQQLAAENPGLPQEVLWLIEDEETLQDPLFLKALEQMRNGQLVSAKPTDTFGDDD